MTTGAKRFARMARRFRRFLGSGAWTRWGMTFAEALVMIVVAGTLMMPVVGTLQTGVDRTTAYVHQDRMRTIAQASMTEILAGSAYARTPVVDFTATVSWPINDPEPVATYVMEVETLEGITLATLTSTIKGDFAGNEALLGSQPANLKTIVITVTHVPDLGDTGVEPAQVRLFSMVATPRSFNPNRIYIADKDNICVYAIDPLTKNVVETFDLPYNKSFAKNKTQNDVFRPGNIAVHPSGDWVLSQRKQSLLLTDVALFSPARRSSVEVFSTSTAYLEDPTDNEKIRKDRGAVFRPDGRYCYVTSHSPSGLSIYSVPETVNASFSLVKFLPLSTAKFTDLQVGEDGYIYLGDYDYSSLCFRRLNMFASQTQAVLEDYKLPGWSANAIAACTSRDGRTVYSIWKGPYIASSSADNPDDWGRALIGWTPALGAEDIQDLQVSGDSRVVVATSKQGGNKARIYALSTALKGNTINPYVAPNTIAFPGNADITNQAVLSPAMNEVWVDRKGAGEIYALDTPGLLAGSYTTAVPADRTVIFIPSGDAGCVAARMSEMIAVACDGPAKTVEFIDPWSKHHYENLSRKLPYGITPSHLAFDGSGSRLSVCYNASSTLPTDIDVFNIDNPPVAIDPENWGPTIARRPTHHIFYQNGGFLIQKYGNSLAANGYVSFDASGTKQADIKFPLTASMSDVIPLNDGGALVLVTDFVASWTRLDRIGSDAKLLAAWDSRFDNFPPNGATQMAISADDGLLVLYVPNSDSPGIGQLWQFFDMRTNNFGPLTQQKGFVTDFRLSERSFAGAVPSAQKMTGATFKLRDTFTCNASGTEANMASYPANFAYTTANKYAGNAGETRSSRFFGYLRIPTPVQTLGLWNRDASQVFIGATPTSILGTILDPYTSGSSATAPFSFSDAASRWIQLNHSSDNPQSDMALFFSPNSGETSTTGTQDYTVNGVTALGPNTADWKRVPAEYTSPLRFTPQYLYSLQNHHNYSPNTNLRVFMCFSRDVASPTLYVFNAPYGGFGVQPFGGSLYIPSFSLTPYSAKGMAITPDGQRLVIAAANPNKIHLIDISTPATSTYMTEVGTIDLPQPPACITARPFNRINTRKNTYEVVATLPTGTGGNALAAVASGGIYILGAQSAILGTPSKKAWQFDPMLSSVTDKGDRLGMAVRDHTVFSYDGNLYSMNGFDSTGGATSWIQRWNPTTNAMLTSADPVPSGRIGHWKFDEGSGVTAADSVGGRHGMLTGNAAWGAGVFGNAVSLDGTSGTKVTLTNGGSLNVSTPFTVALWVKPTLLPNTWEALIGKYSGSASPNYAFSLWTNSGNGTTGDLEIWYGSSRQVLVSNFFSINTWVHIAVTFSGGQMIIYKNGSAVSTTAEATPGVNSVVTAFGGRSDTDTSYRFKGVIDDVQYYSRALSAAEIGVVKGGGPVMTPGIYLEKTMADNGVTEVKRFLRGGAMTPYGYVSGGGPEVGAVGGDRDTCQVYWPHAIASYTDAGTYLLGVSRELPPLTTACHGHSFVYHKGYLYRIGGASWGGSLISGISRFNFSSNTWTLLTTAADTDSLTDPSGLTERYMQAACSFGDEIFIFGGATVAGVCINDPIAWNPDTKLVRRLAPIPFTCLGSTETDTVPVLRSMGMTAVPCGPAIYLIGGGNAWGSGGSGQVLKYTP